MRILNHSCLEFSRGLLVCCCVLAILLSARSVEASQLDQVWEGYYSAARKDSVDKYVGQLRSLIAGRGLKYSLGDVRDRIVPILEDYHQMWAEQTSGSAARLGNMIYDIYRATGGRYRRVIEGADYGWPEFDAAVDEQYKLWSTPGQIRIQPRDATLKIGGSAEFEVSVVNTRGDRLPIERGDLDCHLEPEDLGSLALDGESVDFRAEQEGEGSIVVTSVKKPAVSASAAVTIQWPEPLVTSVEPEQGQIGTRVVIDGSNFYHVDRLRNEVRFGRGVASPDSVRIDRMYVAVPEDAITGPLMVQTPGGLSYWVNDFTVVEPTKQAPVLVGNPPSSKWFVVSAACLAASAVTWVFLNKDAWEKSVDCETGLSDHYKNCRGEYDGKHRLEKIVGAAAIGSAVVSIGTWLWYMHQSKEYAKKLGDNASRFDIKVKPDASGAELIYRF